MQIETEYADENDIPAEVRHLYREGSDGWTIASATQVKSPDDVARLQEALRKEREDHKAAREALKPFEGLNADEVREGLARRDELEAARSPDDPDADEKRAAAEEARIRARVAPLERETERLKGELEEKASALTAFEQSDRHRRMMEAARKAAIDNKLNNAGIASFQFAADRLFEETEDGFVTREGASLPDVKLAAGLTPEIALSEIQRIDTYSGWWPDSAGANARGGDGKSAGANPYAAEKINRTEIGRLVQSDRAKAERLAAAAGKAIDGSPLAA